MSYATGGVGCRPSAPLSITLVGSSTVEEPVSGCTDGTACNYNSEATQDDGSCVSAQEYYDCDNNCLLDSDSDGVCNELEILGCTDATATNYNTSATEDNGSCEYDSTGGDCVLPPAEAPLNTGANMTVMLTPGFLSGLNIQNETAYIVAFDGDLIVGYQDLSSGTQQSLAIWGDDSLTPELDGALSGASISFQLVDGSSLYVGEFANPVVYTTSGLSVQTSAPSSITLVCSETGEEPVLGCTDITGSSPVSEQTNVIDDGALV
jgi:hypothetical protein